MTDEEKKIMKDAIKSYGELAQTDMAIEEMLQQLKEIWK